MTRLQSNATSKKTKNKRLLLSITGDAATIDRVVVGDLLSVARARAFYQKAEAVVAKAKAF